LAESRWQGVHLSSLVREELLPYCSEQMLRTNVSGPDLTLDDPIQAQSLAMVLHELATNAIKYGALSVAAGGGQVIWVRGQDRGGGPRSEPPRHKGFGMRVIKQLVHQQLRGEMRLDWRLDGLTCEIGFS